MRALKISIAVMTVLIVVGVITLVFTITQRLTVPHLAATTSGLSEPAGTRILQIAQSGDRLTLLLQGGGPDRIVVLDLRNGSVVSRIGLAP